MVVMQVDMVEKRLSLLNAEFGMRNSELEENEDLTDRAFGHFCTYIYK